MLDLSKTALLIRAHWILETIMNTVKKIENLPLKTIQSYIPDNQVTSFSSLKITTQLYDCDRENILFTIKDKTGNTFKKTAHEIILDKHMISAFPVNDILTIAYIAGMEHANFDPAHLNIAL